MRFTGNFLFHKSRALEIEYGFAIENHIPVLPIVVEGGLENDFGDCLNRIKSGYSEHILRHNGIIIYRR